ncbi:hypothetical protein M983_2015 [Proteus myxofaciens ATCC 19692]|uniref:Uncharacterized protein n=1 Tax=Proteus myxofaciens ATCC 19692 TaxID=1354337 RepID=A0A198FQ69_9GAMM|nr:hypothetical protein M983_2015 [Proteus myxofaciens ATCC 19692]
MKCVLFIAFSLQQNEKTFKEKVLKDNYVLLRLAKTKEHPQD